MSMYFFLSAIINGISCFVLGVFVLLQNPSKLLNRLYFNYALVIAIWSGGYCFWPFANSKDVAWFSFIFLHVGAVFIPVSWYHFSCALVGVRERNRYQIMFGYLLSTALLITIPTRFFIQDMVPKLIFKYWAIPGIAYHIYIIYFLVYAIAASITIFHGYRQAPEGQIKQQYLYVLLATIIGYVGGITNFPPYYDIPIYPVLNILVTFYVGTLAYAIVRHHLLDIEVIIKRTIVFAGLFLTMYAVIAIFALVPQIFFQNLKGISRWISMVPSVIVIILILRPLERFLISVTDKFLFQKKYDYRELLKAFSTEVLTTFDKATLYKAIVNKLVDVVKIESASLMVYNPAKKIYNVVAAVGLNSGWEKIELKPDNTMIKFVHGTEGYLSVAQKGKASDENKAARNKSNIFKMELAIPLNMHQEMIGVLTLGKKKSDQEYTEEDMDILLPLARTIAISISNADMMARLGQAQAEAAQNEKMASIGTLSAGINHEICNPLGIARGHCEAFLLNMRDGLYKNKSEKELIERCIGIFQKVIHEVDRATVITKRLSSFAKPTKGVYTEDIDFKACIDEVIALLGYEMKLENIVVANEIPSTFPHIMGDRKQMQEVFFNLVRNAAQAIKGSGTITAKGRTEGTKIFVDIVDTGEGIPEDKLEAVFDAFYTTKAPGKGTGLGLFIVRSVVEKNGGLIYVKSKVGMGTTFTVEFDTVKSGF